jgi:hypothetical protein
MSDNDNKVEFRLSPTFLEQLDELLAKHNQTHSPKPSMTRSTFARKFFIEALERESVAEEVKEMNDQLRDFRREVKTTIATLLIEVAKRKPDEVKNFIEKRFLKE